MRDVSIHLISLTFLAEQTDPARVYGLLLRVYAMGVYASRVVYVCVCVYSCEGMYVYVCVCVCVCLFTTAYLVTYVRQYVCVWMHAMRGRLSLAPNLISSHLIISYLASSQLISLSLSPHLSISFLLAI